MVEGYWLGMAALAALVGMGWLALSVDNHWRQVAAAPCAQADAPGPRLRPMGALSLVTALLFCLIADHPSMAVLVWVMLLAASAIAITMMLTWRPQWLRPLVLPWSASAVSAK